MTTRIPCVVPGCRHTRGDRKGDPIREGMEWICGDHWKLVPMDLKRMKTRAERAVKIGEADLESIDLMAVSFARTHDGGVHNDIIDRYAEISDHTVKKSRQARRIWERCKKVSIERALGI